MAIIVEHDERRKKILERALDVFVDDGFEGATFQKIADRCGITRTILYLYFKNKREIFTFSIKQLLSSAEENIKKIRDDKSLNCSKKVTQILFSIFDLFDKNRQMLSVVLDYFLHTLKGDTAPEARVRRRTVKMRHVLSTILIEGVKSGEFKKIDIKTANDYLYSFVESAIFQMVILKRSDFSELKEAAAFAVQQLKA